MYHKPFQAVSAVSSCAPNGTHPPFLLPHYHQIYICALWDLIFPWKCAFFHCLWPQAALQRNMFGCAHDMMWVGHPIDFWVEYKYKMISFCLQICHHGIFHVHPEYAWCDSIFPDCDLSFGHQSCSLYLSLCLHIPAVSQEIRFLCWRYC